jgi:hypothetical protein
VGERMRIVRGLFWLIIIGFILMLLFFPQFWKAL